MKRKLLAGLALAALLVTGADFAQAQTKLTVYTALENDQLVPFKNLIQSGAPDVEVEWVRDSTGVITSRFIAEKDNPRADIVVGLAATSLLTFKKMDLLAEYKPKGADTLKADYRDRSGPYNWTGMDAFLGVICFNTAEAKKENIATPTSWQDLLQPSYKGKVVMPHPASSGTGYLTIAAWLQIMGEEKAWAFMDKLHENIAVYTHSGSAPCVQAAKGERMAGIALDMRGVKEKSSGAPLEVVIPKEGVGWDMEAYGIVKGTKNMAAAQKVADILASKAANELYGKYYAIVAHPEVNAKPANYPAAAEGAMAKNDFAWMAEHRDRILKEWSKRYEGKAAPK